VDGQLVLNDDGTLAVSPPDAHLCEQCGHLRSDLDEWNRCQPCAAADRAEAQRLAHIVSDALASLTPGQRADTAVALITELVL
jgi:hypothetical protein